MAAGVPVIASSSGGVPEIIDNRVNGLLFSTGNEVDLSEKIYKLLKDKNLSALLARNAIEKAKEFDLKKMLNKYHKLYFDKK
jgi:glycosyltransferase involved in cell wall biosynthesis